MIIVRTGHFETAEEVNAELVHDNMHGHMLVDPPIALGDPHTHDFEARFYIFDGTVTLTDADTGESYYLLPCMRAIVEPGTAHYEHIHSEVTMVYATSVPPPPDPKPEAKAVRSRKITLRGV
jgi:mannose-6-phosphate isomerase-like protein (cupin superfamily)